MVMPVKMLDRHTEFFKYLKGTFYLLTARPIGLAVRRYLKTALYRDMSLMVAALSYVEKMLHEQFCIGVYRRGY